jgi:hypothetical protein
MKITPEMISEMVQVLRLIDEGFLVQKPFRERALETAKELQKLISWSDNATVIDLEDSPVDPLSDPPTYDDVYITTEYRKRMALKDLPYGYRVTCDVHSGWQVWLTGPYDNQLIGGEHAAFNKGIRIDVYGFVICDSLREKSDG